MNKRQAIENAIKIAGGLQALADQVEDWNNRNSELVPPNRMTVTRQAVKYWQYSGTAPKDRVLAIEACTGVSRYDLRPDMYGLPPRGHKTEIKRIRKSIRERTDMGTKKIANKERERIWGETSI